MDRVMHGFDMLMMSIVVMLVMPIVVMLVMSIVVMLVIIMPMMFMIFMDSFIQFAFECFCVFMKAGGVEMLYGLYNVFDLLTAWMPIMFMLVSVMEFFFHLSHVICEVFDVRFDFA